MPNWWGGSTGSLKSVRVDVVGDVAEQVRGLEQGRYDILGYLPASSQPAVPAETIIRYRSNPALARQLRQRPWLRSDFVGFNVRSGPLAGAAGRPARQAFSLAIDRDRYAQDACEQATSCVAATGGVIVKGLSGYLGDRGDPNSGFDPARARAAYAAWDPDGSR